MPENFLWELLATLIYAVIGLFLLGMSVLAMEKMTSFSIRHEIEEDQNVALGVLMGSIVLGMAIIIAAVIMS